jgi:HlyD family secretion protein
MLVEPPTVPRPSAPAPAPTARAPLAEPHPPVHPGREQHRELARRARRALVGVLVAAATVAVVMALRPRPVPVDVASVLRGPLIVAVEESGRTRVKDRYVVSAPAAGSLSRIALDAGDNVKERDVLAEIAPAAAPLLDPRARAESEARLGAASSALGQARAQVGRALSAMTLASQELARVQKLAASGVMTPQALEQAEFDARMRADEHSAAVFAEKVAAEEVRLAQVTLGSGGRPARDRHLDVVAPASGRVFRVFQKSAGVVPAGTPLLEVGDPGALEIVSDLLTTAAVQVRPGTAVTITGWGGEGPLAGRVRLIEPSGFTKPSALGVDEQRVNVVVALTDPRERWASLGDGYRVETRMVLWQAADVLKAPQGAVFRHGDGWAAFRIDNGRAELVAVQIGHRGDAEVEILSGLEPGTTVAVHPGDRVKSGARVELR